MEPIIAIIASPAVALAVVKWFLKDYQKKTHALEKARIDQVNKEIARIEQAAKQMTFSVERLRDSVSKTDKDLAVMVEKLKFQASDVEHLLRAFHGFVEQTGKRLNDVEGRVTEIAKDVLLFHRKERK